MQVGEVLVCRPLGGKVGTSVLLCPMCGAPSSQQWFLRGSPRGNHQGGEGSWGQVLLRSAFVQVSLSLTPGSTQGYLKIKLCCWMEREVLFIVCFVSLWPCWCLCRNWAQYNLLYRGQG